MAEKTYKQLQEELDEILHKLEAGNVGIDEAVNLHKEGQDLLKKLEQKLKSAKNSIKTV